jgi:hypothetical protein
MNEFNKHFEDMLTLDPNKNVSTNEDKNENTSDEDGKPKALGRIILMTNSAAPVSRSAQSMDKDQQA